MKIFRIALLASLLPGCVVHRPSLEGRVQDSVTGAPIRGIEVRRVVGYDFLFSVGGNAQTEYLYNEETRTDSAGGYKFPSLVRVMPPGGHRVRESIEIYETRDYFGEPAQSVSLGLWKDMTVLVPKVMKLEDCQNNELCLRLNALRARHCFLNPAHAQDCSRRSPGEWSEYFDEERDFLGCRGKSDLETVNCIEQQVSYETLAIPSERSCAVLESELPRNYCYYLLAGRFEYRRDGDCERITDKEVPTSWVGNVAELGQVGASLGYWAREKGLRDFRSMCLSRR